MASAGLSSATAKETVSRATSAARSKARATTTIAPVGDERPRVSESSRGSTVTHSFWLLSHPCCSSQNSWEQRPCWSAFAENDRADDMKIA
jgi:hypothetical protein